MIKENVVNIKISPNIYKKYYDKYGPFNCNDIIEVYVCDLTKSSTVLVTAICRDCNIHNSVKYSNYNIQFERGGYYCCHRCSLSKNKKTNLIKYGTECVLQNIDIISKSKKTLIDKFGVDNISKLDSVKDTRRDNFKNVIEKSKITWLIKYGFDNPSKSSEIKRKKEKTTFKNFGVYNPSQSPYIFEKSQISGKKIKTHISGILYRGSYEKDFIEFCINKNIKIEKGPTIKYYQNEKIRFYHSDFYLPEFDLICEIKSGYYYNRFIETNMLKKQFSEKYHNFIFIIDKNYSHFESIINIK